MKQILSILLAAVTLVSAIAGSAYAYDKDVYNSIKNENVMSFKVTNAATGKESATFAPGDEIHITAKMDSIWGDPAIEDDIVGYDGNVLPGAYGMNIIVSSLVFPVDNFTPKAGSSAAGKSTINNFTNNCLITKTSVNDAKRNGAYSFMTEALIMNEDEDRYTFFTGSGELCTWKLTVNDDAKPGTYKLPIGSYLALDGNGENEGYSKKYKFFGKTYADLGHADSQLYNRPVKFTSPTDEYVNDDPECGAFITVTIGKDGGSAKPPTQNTPPAKDAMSFTFASDGKAHKAGDTVNVTLSIKNNEGIDQNVINSQFSFDNTSLELVSVSTSVKGLEAPKLDLASINNKGKFEDLGKADSIDCYFDGFANITKDAELITLTFKVLSTAHGSETKISGSSNDGHKYPDAVIKFASNHTHKFVATVIRATCTAGGHTDTACSCGLSYRTSKSAATGHTISTDPADVLTIAPTQTDKGFTTHRCSLCHGAAKVVYTEALG